MWIFFLWNIAALAAGIYCVTKAVMDLRLRRYTWGAVGLASAAVFLLTPIQTHSVKVDLPVAAQ